MATFIVTVTTTQRIKLQADDAMSAEALVVEKGGDASTAEVIGTKTEYSTLKQADTPGVTVLSQTKATKKADAQASRFQ